MRRALIVAVLLLASGAAGSSRDAVPPTGAADGDLVFHDATVIDGTTRPHVDVIVRGGRIATVAPHRRHSAGATVIDCAGKYLLPGFTDMHVHVLAHPWDRNGNLRPQVDRDASLAILRLLLQNGVTTVRDAGSETESAVALRDRVNAGKIEGPRIVTAGRILNASSFNPEPFKPVRTPADVRREIRLQKSAGVDLIKIYSAMPPDLTRAAIEEAHALGLPVIGHLQATTWTEAARLGIDGIEHFAPWSPEYLSPDARAEYQQTLFGRVYWLEHVDIRGSAISEMIEAMKRRGVVLDPTLVALATKFFGNDPRWVKSPDLALAPKAFTDGWPKGSFTADWTDAQYEEAQTKAWPKELALIRRMNEAGVTMTIGTDTPTPWIVPGTSVHDEMELLVSAGIPAPAVLAMGTRNAARALHLEKEMGAIAPGFRADIVLLAKNPLEDIRNTRSIAAVFHDGRRVR